MGLDMPRILRTEEEKRANHAKYSREWASRNREKVRSWTQRWKDNNPDHIPDYGRRRRHGIEPEQYKRPCWKSREGFVRLVEKLVKECT